MMQRLLMHSMNNSHQLYVCIVLYDLCKLVARNYVTMTVCAVAVLLLL